MQFIDLRSQYDALQHQIQRRVDSVLAHGKFIMGPEVQMLEEALAEFCGVRHAVSCGNGTDALVLALRALNVGPGDAVFTTPFTFFATAEAIVLAGARPVFADINPQTFNIDPASLEDKIAWTSREGRFAPKAVITVDLFGLPADYDSIEPICTRHGVHLIEDAAQGFGGAIGGRRAGSFGCVATTSFFPAKPLGCYGDGGALFTSDDSIAERLRSLRMHGKGQDKYDNVRVGTNSRLDTIQAAILLEKLAAFPQELDARQRIAEQYRERLPDEVERPVVPDSYLSSWAQYSVLASDAGERTRLVSGLSHLGVPTNIYYSRPLHLQTALADLGCRDGDFPVSEEVSGRIFSLPMGPYLAGEDQDRVIEALQSLCASAGAAT